jgi:hypothetical protein
MDMIERFFEKINQSNDEMEDRKGKNNKVFL